MRLSSIQYKEWEGTPKAWLLDTLVLRDINLLVGRNASGKSRSLNLINGLAALLIGKRQMVTSGEYCAVFEHGQNKITYHLKVVDGSVVRETLSKDDAKSPLLDRGENGIGSIYYENEGATTKFQLPQNQLAALARQDNLQHSFLLPLNEWATRTYHYPFGTDMGQGMIGLLHPDVQAPIDFHDVRQVLGVYRKGEHAFKAEYKNSIIQDMRSIGYDIDDVGLMKPSSVVITGPVPIDPVYLYVKERSLPVPTEQTEMSQGMFRALSTLVHLTYGYQSNEPNFFLIDDIGEGLDLIDVIIQRVKGSHAQLLMATNDRFVMNSVPLEYWSVLERQGATIKVRNYENTKQKFEDFKFTGLNNFDFFASDFLHSEETKL
jgi:energy-coupling factor transporter ATP-binding protein EcfA2